MGRPERVKAQSEEASGTASAATWEARDWVGLRSTEGWGEPFFRERRREGMVEKCTGGGGGGRVARSERRS